MKSALLALALLLASLPLRAQEAAPDSSGPVYPQRAPGGYRRMPDARQGLLLSFGLGGGSAYLSNENAGRTGVFDFDFRLGYGFSDRFQLFMDFGGDAGHYPQRPDFYSWTFTIRGQTVLIGDRAGNGLNLNAGVGIGGVDYTDSYYYGYSSSTGFAAAGGISYDARITPWFAISPEFFVNWHEIPNSGPYANDVSSVFGGRLNFLWYLK